MKLKLYFLFIFLTSFFLVSAQFENKDSYLLTPEEFYASSEYKKHDPTNGRYRLDSIVESSRFSDLHGCKVIPKDLFYYDQNGKIANHISYDVREETGVSIIRYQARTQYDNQGRLNHLEVIKSITEKFCKSESAVNSTLGRVYDYVYHPENGQLQSIEVSGWVYDSAEYYSKLYKEELEFDQNTLISRLRSNYDKDSEQWIPRYKNERTYLDNDHPNEIKIFEYDESASQWMAIYTTLYEMNEGGQVTLEQQFDINSNGTEEKNTKFETEYDENDLIVDWKEYNSPDGEIWLEKDWNKFQYTLDQNISQKEMWSYVDDAWQASKKFEYNYSPNHEIVEENEFIMDNSLDIWVKKRTFEYYCDSIEVDSTFEYSSYYTNVWQLIERLNTFYIDKAPYLKVRTFTNTFNGQDYTFKSNYYYDELMNTHTHEQRDLAIYPNPSQGLFHFKQALKGVEVLYVYSMDGKLVKQIKLSNQQRQVDLSMLKPGVYLLKILDKATIFKKKVIIF